MSSLKLRKLVTSCTARMVPSSLSELNTQYASQEPFWAFLTVSDVFIGLAVAWRTLIGWCRLPACLLCAGISCYKRDHYIINREWGSVECHINADSRGSFALLKLETVLLKNSVYIHILMWKTDIGQYVPKMRKFTVSGGPMPHTTPSSATPNFTMIGGHCRSFGEETGNWPNFEFCGRSHT